MPDVANRTARPGVVPIAEMRAYGLMQGAGTSILPAAIGVHRQTLTALVAALACWRAGKTHEMRDPLRHGIALVDVLKRAVTPGSPLSGDLIRIYDYLVAGLKGAQTVAAIGDRLEVAVHTIVHLTSAWEARRINLAAGCGSLQTGCEGA